MPDPRPFHRLFGLAWAALCDGTDLTVETELDLSVKSQFVDMVLTWKGDKPLAVKLPDGFDNIGRINVVTFKSFREPLDAFALCELIGHYANQRKQASPSFEKLLPESDFRLYAVCARSPINLIRLLAPKEVGAGVYEYHTLGLSIRIIVANQLPIEEQNAMLHLFSSDAALLKYGQDHYRPNSNEFSTLLYQMLKQYAEEVDMSEKHKQQLRQMFEEMMKKLPLEERLAGATAEELLKSLPAEELIHALSQKEVLNSLSPEMRAQLAQRLMSNDQPKQ